MGGRCPLPHHLHCFCLQADSPAVHLEGHQCPPQGRCLVGYPERCITIIIVADSFPGAETTRGMQVAPCALRLRAQGPGVCSMCHALPLLLQPPCGPQMVSDGAESIGGGLAGGQRYPSPAHPIDHCAMEGPGLPGHVRSPMPGLQAAYCHIHAGGGGPQAVTAAPRKSCSAGSLPRAGTPPALTRQPPSQPFIKASRTSIGSCPS